MIPAGDETGTVELLAESLPDAPATTGGADVPALLAESETYVKAVAEALRDLAAQGFPHHFDIDDTGVHCLACRSRCASVDVSWLTHSEVACPVTDETAYVAGLRCPICGARGTATVTAEQWDNRRAARSRHPSSHSPR